MQQMVPELVGQGYIVGAVLGSVILYFAHIMHMFSSKLYATDLAGYPVAQTASKYPASLS